MSIIRAKRERNYSVISNDVWRDNQLSFQAMGMLSYILSKPDNWSVSPSHLEKVTDGTAKKTGRDGVYSILKELKSVGFIKTQKHACGKTDYIVSDHPCRHVKPSADKADEGKPNTDKPDLANTDKADPNTPNPDQANPDLAEPTLISTDNKQVLISNNKNKQKENSHELLFEKFWKSYPKKTNKQGALKSFNAAIKKQTLTPDEFTEMLIIDVTERIKRNQFGFDRLHATTYLNNERWNDEHENNQPRVNESGHRPNSIEAYNERLLAKYGHATAPIEREINPVDSLGLGQHQVSGSVYEQVGVRSASGDLGAGD
ncbi:hypothetical protein M3894_002908 [Vibrio metschnikovii]|nr:hypothetical protein [Vibrio metschnikovii]